MTVDQWLFIVRAAQDCIESHDRFQDANELAVSANANFDKRRTEHSESIDRYKRLLLNYAPEVDPYTHHRNFLADVRMPKEETMIQPSTDKTAKEP